MQVDAENWAESTAKYHRMACRTVCWLTALYCSFAIAQAADETPPIPKAATIEIHPDESRPFSGNSQWKNVPPYLQGAQIFEKASLASPELRFKIKKSGVVLIAASWNYEGGGWEDTDNKGRQLLGDVMHDGWTPIATMNFKDGDEHVVFRREVTEGQQLTFHTRNQIAPFVITIPESAVATVMAQKALVSADRRTLLSRNPGAGADRVGTTTEDVVLLRMREPEKARPAWIRGLLLREIVRQGVSLAVREQLGLPTRDAALRERLPQQAGATNFPLEMDVVVQSTYDVETALYQRRGDRWETIWDDILTFPRDHFIERLVTAVEKLSRTELAVALQGAGFKGREPPPSRDTSPLPAGVEDLMQDFSIPSQFAALRLLHSEIASHGQSPELLGRSPEPTRSWAS